MRDGERSFGELLSDAHRFRDWYGVGGFYLAGAPAGKAELASVRRVSDALRGLGQDMTVVLGHGTHPYEGYAEAADQLVTFAGAWADYRWSQVAEWTADHPAERFCHLVHGVPRTHLEEAVRIARWQGAGTIWLTDRRGPSTGTRGPRCPRTGTKSSRRLGRVSWNEDGRGSVTGRTTIQFAPRARVGMLPSTECPCRCHRW